MFENLSVETKGAIGELRLTRPDKLNPLSTQTLQELARAAKWFDDQRAVKVVIVRGEGRAFSAGADLASFSNKGDLPTRDAADTGREMAEALEAMRAISIASIPTRRAATPAPARHSAAAPLTAGVANHAKTASASHPVTRPSALLRALFK